MLGDKTTGKHPGSAQHRDPDSVPAQPAEPRERADGPVFESSELFGGHKQVSIEHNGERYVLKITRLGKLVLNK